MDFPAYDNGDDKKTYATDELIIVIGHERINYPSMIS